MEVSQRITHMHLKTKAEQIACHHIGFLAASGRFVGPEAASVDVADILPIKSGDCNQVCVASSQDTHTKASHHAQPIKSLLAGPFRHCRITVFQQFFVSPLLMAMLFPQGLRETVVCIRLMAMQFPP